MRGSVPPLTLRAFAACKRTAAAYLNTAAVSVWQ